MRTERVNLSPEGNGLSDASTSDPIGAEPKIRELAGATVIETSPRSLSWWRKTLKIFGPGLVTGAADDDPSGIATYSSVGAQFGSSILWTMPLIYPFMAAIQEISARTWGQNLLHHPHLHCVVAGGGLSADGSQWRRARSRFTRTCFVMSSLDIPPASP